ncbi:MULTISPECIES: stage II sporulation protein M [unclassified Paenibacillus]|uniref:stage II sporulation protein M n=1 Tax=unclassified Paenibacillus TaxID=185978 RepID=UPI0003E28D09|nr:MULTISPECIES: stage II sporulation protein M [unclassified Paenibacillus]ETT44217.1 stage II sporulation protein M [Paenibacillus sp. FSL R7-269]OMF99752.1 stage II sporulation protein M [Paenibacillus sp. FSL R7-0337]
MRSLKLMVKEQTPLYIFVAVLFLVGVVFGALIVTALTLDQQQELGDYLSNFFVTVDQQGLPDAQDSYWSIAAFHLKWVGLIWVLGLSVIGLPGILILDFLKGVLIGFTVGTLVSQYSWHGMLFALVSVAPHNLVLIPVLLVCSAAALGFSLLMIRSRVLGQQRRTQITHPFMMYTLLSLGMALLVMGISGFEAYVTPVMMRWVTPLLVSAG